MYKRIVFSIGVALLFATAFWYSSDRYQKPVPEAVKGVLDLTAWKFSDDGRVPLSGEYEFYWLHQIHPDSFRLSTHLPAPGVIRMPEFWNDQIIDGSPLPGHGYATYRLRVKTTSEGRRLAFKFLDMGTAFKAFADGKEILTVGQPGTTPATTVPYYSPEIVDFTPVGNEIELVLWVSNFDHRKGGAWEKIELGPEKELRSAEKRRFAFELTLLISMIVMGAYHILLFILRREDWHLLYFGVFCLLVSLRFTTQGEVYLIQAFPGIPWSLLVRIEYLSYYMAPVTFIIFLYSLYPQDFHLNVYRAIKYICLGFSLVVVFTDVNIFSHTVSVFHWFTVSFCFYGIAILTKSVRNKREGARLILVGSALLTIAVGHDILEYMRIIQNVEIMPFGLLGFVFCLTILIAMRFSKAFRTVESQHKKLAIANEKYKEELNERKRTEKENQILHEKLTRSQKMEALGLLAGGMAHDLNNILAGIVTYPDFLLLELPADSPLREPLETIRASGQRAATVVQDLLTLARRGVVQFEVINLNNLIRDYLRSPEHQKLLLDHRSVHVETNLESGLFNMLGSQVHLKKIVMNLLYNAAEAQPKGGVIRLSTHNKYVDEVRNGYEDITEGTYVVLRVEDKGIGIAPEDLKKIFEPFYTRKIMGTSGTGLGMSVVWGSVHDHQGFIDVKSEKNVGTIFELYFPVTHEQILPDKAEITLDDMKGNGERIMIVDDIEEQRVIASAVLKRLGYHVVTMGSGEEAVEYIKDVPVDLVVLDMIMDPGIDGLETYKRMIEIEPDIKSIIASGYAESDEVRQAQKLGAGKYIRKPYTLHKLGLAIKEELNYSLYALEESIKF